MHTGTVFVFVFLFFFFLQIENLSSDFHSIDYLSICLVILWIKDFANDDEDNKIQCSDELVILVHNARNQLISRFFSSSSLQNKIFLYETMSGILNEIKLQTNGIMA